MSLLKYLPQDFIVEEIPDVELRPGPYTILKITKQERNTEDVASELAKKLHLSRKQIGYAGSKDRQAITIQYFSVKKELTTPPSLNNCETSIIGTAKEALHLGMLKGNKFTITLRKATKLTTPKCFPNYFDEQRFSRHNAAIGMYLLKKEFKQAATLINETTNHKLNLQMPINELQQIPRQIIKLYLHAAQSLLWNNIAGAHIQSITKTKTKSYSQGVLHFPQEKVEQTSIPMPGFAVEYAEFDDLIKQVLKQEGLTDRDFVIRQLPNLSLEGTTRKLLIDVQDLNIDYQQDEIFKGEQKAIITFTLPRGNYATMVIKALDL